MSKHMSPIVRSVSHQRELGVIVDETLINVSLMNITPTLFNMFYGTFIRPHLENSFQAWRSWLRKDMKLLEDINRGSTKLVKSLQSIEYEGRAQLLNLDSLPWTKET